MSPHAAMRSATARFKPCLLIVVATGRLRRHLPPDQAAEANPTLTAHDKGDSAYRRIRQTGRRDAQRPAGVGTGGQERATGGQGPAGLAASCPRSRACAPARPSASSITHVAFQTGHTTGVVGRALGRFDLAVAVFFALSGFLLWRGHAAAARGLRETPADGALSAVPDRAHHAGLPGRGGRDPVAVARRQQGPDGLAGQSLADPDLRAADADRRADADVEPVGRGDLLSGAAVPRVCGAVAAGAGADPGDRRRSRWRASRWGLLPVHGAVRRQSADVAACLLLVVRRGNGAGRVDGRPGRVGAPVGAAAGADGRDRRGWRSWWRPRRWQARRG